MHFNKKNKIKLNSSLPLPEVQDIDTSMEVHWSWALASQLDEEIGKMAWAIEER